MSKTILLADDSVTIQKVVELTFMDQDYEVVAVSDGQSALAKLAESRPDLVIADVHMPEANGYEVCRQAKATHPGIPVLLLVGTFEPFDLQQANAVGADSHLKKPFDSQDLLRQVDTLISQSGGGVAAPAAAQPAAAPAAPAPPAAPPPAAPQPAMAQPPAPPPVAPAPVAPPAAPPPTAAPVAPPAPEPAPAVPEFEPLAFEAEPAAVVAPEPTPIVPEPTPAVPEPPVVPEPAPAVAAPEPALAVPEPAPVVPEPAPAPAAPEPEAAPPAAAAETNGPLSDEDVDRVARRLVELMGGDVLRQVAWEVVPDLAEVVIKERLRELESQVE